MEVGNVGSDQLLDGEQGLGGSRPSVLGDDQSSGADLSSVPISISLETNELPFQQPDPRIVPVETAGRDWRATLVRAGRWPLVAIGLAAVLTAVFATFIARNGALPDGQPGTAEPVLGLESAPAAATITDQDDGSQRADVGAGALGVSDGSALSSGRSTGGLGPGEGSGYFPGQVVEPDESLTGSEVDFTTTTVAPPPTTASSTTNPPDTSVTSTSTATTDTTAGPPEPQARPIGPGNADAADPAVVAPGRVTLEAEGVGDELRYRFTVYVQNDGGWRRVGRSRWRSDPTWTVRVGRLEGRTVRWTVIGLAEDGERTDESPPLYFYVGEEEEPEEDSDAAQAGDVELANGDFDTRMQAAG